MGSVLCVDALDVALQMVGAAEPLVANFTLVGFNSSVDGQVPLQVDVFCKSYSACWTDKGLLSSVSAQVSFENRWTGESFITRVTGVGFVVRVFLHVSVQV